MRRVRVWSLYVLCAPWDGGVLLLVAPLLWLFGGRGVRLGQGALWLDVARGSSLERRWRYSTTLGHLVLLQPGLEGSRVEAHELVHVRQFEGAVCSVWLMLLAGGLTTYGSGVTLGLALTALLGPWWSYAGGSAAAWLRGERPYLDNHFERHARAEAELAGH